MSLNKRITVFVYNAIHIPQNWVFCKAHREKKNQQTWHVSFLGRGVIYLRKLYNHTSRSENFPLSLCSILPIIQKDAGTGI